MASTPMYDPLTSEARSPWLAGLTEACYKLSNILDLKTETFSDLQLFPVDRRRLIYQAPLGRKLWLDNPKPVVRKNGIIITEENNAFTINYLGGSVEFERGLDDVNVPDEADTITVDATYIIDKSSALADLADKLEGLRDVATKFQGYFPSLESLEAVVGPGNAGDYAIVGGTDNIIYIWNITSQKWEETGKQPDMTQYYTKVESDELLNLKENTIVPHGEGTESYDYYYSGRKTWVDINEKVKDVPLTGLDTSLEGPVDENDTVQSAIGKLQNQADKNKGGLLGTGAPTEDTEGDIGQEYTNTSNGDKYHLISITGDGKYIWARYQDKLIPDDSITIEGNNIRVTNPVKGVTAEQYEALTDEEKASGLYIITDAPDITSDIQQNITILQSQIADKADIDDVVPITRKVNNKPLSTDITLNASDVGALAANGTAVAASKLATARTIRTNLASTSAASFDGTANITPGVTGVLPVANGGTGSSTEKYLPLVGGTLTGDLRIKGSGNYGTKINLGDGDYVHISEPTDDNMEIKAKTVKFVTTKNSSGIDIDDLKTSVSEGKAAIASAITDKGVSTSATASFSTMASNIRSINQNIINWHVGSFGFSSSPILGHEFILLSDFSNENNDFVTTDVWVDAGSTANEGFPMNKSILVVVKSIISRKSDNKYIALEPSILSGTATIEQTLWSSNDIEAWGGSWAFKVWASTQFYVYWRVKILGDVT